MEGSNCNMFSEDRHDAVRALAQRETIKSNYSKE